MYNSKYFFLIFLFSYDLVLSLMQYHPVPIRCRGGFDTIPRTRLRCKQSHMPCNLVNFISVNWESEVRQKQQWGEDMRKKEKKRKERARERKKGVKLSNPSGQGKECGTGDQLSPPWIRRCPAMSGRLSLCAGVKVPKRMGSGIKVARRRERGLRGACAALL